MIKRGQAGLDAQRWWWKGNSRGPGAGLGRHRPLFGFLGCVLRAFPMARLTEAAVPPGMVFYKVTVTSMNGKLHV